MTEAHVPPRAVGNRGEFLERAHWVSDSDGARLSDWRRGGLSVYGLCRDCNHVTSGRADPAYIEFHNQVARMRRPTVQRLLIEPDALPARLAPGLVARSVL